MKLFIQSSLNETKVGIFLSKTRVLGSRDGWNTFAIPFQNSFNKIKFELRVSRFEFYAAIYIARDHSRAVQNSSPLLQLVSFAYFVYVTARVGVVKMKTWSNESTSRWKLRRRESIKTRSVPCYEQKRLLARLIIAVVVAIRSLARHSSERRFCDPV